MVFVSPVGAARFVNWLSNGQGGGGTESGSYTLGGGTPFARTPAARVFLPSADEWYKAAFYKGGSSDAGYWKYANASDTAPVSAAPGTPNAANYYRDDGLNNGVNDGYALTGDPGPSVNPAVSYVSDVGAYSATRARDSATRPARPQDRPRRPSGPSPEMPSRLTRGRTARRCDRRRGP